MNDYNGLKNYFLKTANVLRVARYSVFLLFVIFLLICVSAFGKDITLENFNSILKYVSVHDGTGDMYQGEFSINGSDNARVYMLRDNPAVVQNDNVSLYELTGAKLYSYDISFSYPVVVGDNQNFLVYDLESPSLSIFNSLSKVYTSDSFTAPIRCADINSHGFVAVSNLESYKSVMFVYDKDFNEVFRWKSADNYITSVSYGNHGNSIAVSCVNSKDGSFKSVLKVFDKSKKSVVAEKSFIGEMPVSIRFSTDEKYLYLITDSQIHFYDNSLKEIAVYKFNQSKIDKFYQHEDVIILTERNNLLGNSMTITGLSCNGKILFQHNVADEVYDVKIFGNNFYTLGKKSVIKFSYDSKGNAKKQNEQQIDLKFNGIFTDTEGRCYAYNEAKAYRIDFASKADKEQKK